MRYLKRISILTAFLLMFTLIHVTVAEDGIVLDVAERIEEALEIEMDEVNADGLEALDVPLFSLEAVNLELRDAEDTQLISESEEQTETQEKANDSGDFEIDEDGELTRYRGFAKNVVIPNGVKGIGDYAFSNATLVESVSIPYSITYIESSAFYNCTGLKSITIPDSVTEIGGCAFSDCESLANVQLSKNLTEISPSLFDGCISLEQIILANGIRKIGDSAFSSCEKIKSIVLPDKKLKLKATLPKDTASALTWTSSRPKIASVDKKGNVRALKKGTAVITVKTFNGRTAKVTIKVK